MTVEQAALYADLTTDQLLAKVKALEIAYVEQRYKALELSGTLTDEQYATLVAPIANVLASQAEKVDRTQRLLVQMIKVLLPGSAEALKMPE